jgi:hypothetical protein
MQDTNDLTEMEFETCEDRTLYFTLSLYVPARKVHAALGRPLLPADMRSFQPDYLQSLRLRDAIEPLFNDIADRERLGAVNDFLLDTPGKVSSEWLEASVPDMIEWETEGRRFQAAPPELSVPRRLRLKRFWYVHANGAMSWHLSFRIGFEHRPGDYYFLSLLQKAAAPKEFKLPRMPGAAPVRPTDAKTNLLPLDKFTLKPDEGPAQPFWHFIKDRFESDAQHLFGALARHFNVSLKAPRFSNMVMEAPFIEVPGLIMPVARLLFFFQDQVFFNRLLPPPDPATGKPPPMPLMVQDPCYKPYREEVKESLDPASAVRMPLVRLDQAFWKWAIERPEYAALTPEQFAAGKATRPAMEPGRTDCLDYLFIAGFNQNIIDFMNQDASEILDSIDPIYPVTEEQADESFFVRFANQRAMTTYVKSSRSLESGNDYIGTCPYAFLIHAVSLHNEFLTRDYEQSAFQLVSEVETLNQKKRLTKAAEKFYAFRMHDFGDYHRDLYLNVFRYDTERDVFEAIEQLRGTERKSKYLAQLIDNLEDQTRDREARIAKEDEATLTIGLGALGFFKLAFEWAKQLERFGEKGKAYARLMADGALYFSIGFTVLLLLFIAWRLLRRWWR